MQISTDVSQVGVSLFPSFWSIFYHSTFPGFSFILIECKCRYIMTYRRNESDTYLTHVCRHRQSRQITMKMELSASTVAFISCRGRQKLQYWLKAPVPSIFIVMSAPAMSTDMSQVGVTLFPFFNMFFIILSF